jgi:type I restriction enzyme R subunit
MRSTNFEFLRSRHPVLADLAGFAERYAHPDPSGSLIKQRSFIEHLVGLVYEAYRLPAPFTDNLNDLLINEAFASAVPEIIRQKLHGVRRAGNIAAHPRRPITTYTALETLKHTFDLGQWLHLQVDGGTPTDLPTFEAPGPDAGGDRKSHEALERLRLAEAKYESILATLETERQTRLKAEQAATASQEELKRLLDAGENAARTLHFNELTTRRRLIDQSLVDAGWDVGPSGRDTEQVRQEVRLATDRTSSGEELADYVLYGDNGKPIAVVEVKKTVKDPKSGAEQARLYANSLESATGQRPVIFFTNGLDLYIWDDVQGYPWRKIYGFYSKDSLDYLVHQRTGRKPLVTIEPDLRIADRIYQLEAIKRVSERFTEKARKALIVQATGTGKTRVCVSLCNLLMTAGWAKRILFLCDRRELRRQADNVFKEYLPGEPRVVIESATSWDRDKRIYLSTYPAMLKCYESFDAGFFDLIIADESHRSIYNVYGSLFKYFDALQVGLTATPRDAIHLNTYKLFGCEDGSPTSYYGYDEAINSRPAFLVPFRVREYQTGMRERGLKYSEMTKEQREQLEEQAERPEEVEYEATQIDREVFNRDTTRILLRSLMDEGIRDSTGSKVGKTIVFARNHNHAVHLAEVFSEMYPQYGSTFCRVIDNQVVRAEQLIDDFKNPDNDLTIAISVDMLDTGVDIPEVVNLVFAKPVKSYVKFWQMIGRGTRLRKDLFGPGKHKTEFLIQDHWGNFDFFGQTGFDQMEPARPKPLLQRLFEARLALAATALDRMDESVFQASVDLLRDDIVAVTQLDSIDVRERRKELELLADRERIAQFAAATESDLREIAAPLMRWRNIRGNEAAYRFDLLITRLELELLRGGPQLPSVLDLKAKVEEQVELLMKHQNPVKAKADTINTLRSNDFWDNVTVSKLEHARIALRGVMKFQQEVITTSVAPRVFDVMDDDFSAKNYVPTLEGLDLVAYRKRVQAVLDTHFMTSSVLTRIRDGQVVAEADLEELATLVLRVDDKADVKQLAGRDPQTKLSLLSVFRSLVGLDMEAVEGAFRDFVHAHPRLSSQQLRFLQLLQNHIARNGGIMVEQLYDSPFTTIHAEGVDGVFPDPTEAERVIAIAESFRVSASAAATTPPEMRAS